MNDNKITPDEIQEEQLSVTFDDLSLKNGVMPTAEYLETKAKLQEKSGTERPKTKGKPADEIIMDEPENAPKKPQTKAASPAKKSAPPEKPSTHSAKTTAPAEKPQALPEKPPKPLSDMEVMEHTASVWQYKEIENDGTELHTEFHEKHSETDFAEIIGARVRGKKHKHEGTNCDDFFETAYTDDCAVVIVCDGAGSKPLSRIGSRVSSETAAAYLKENLAGLFKARPDVKKGLCADLSSAEFMSACGMIAPLVQQSAREAFSAQRKKLEELCADSVYENALGRKPVISDLYTTFLAAVAVPVEVNGARETFLACVQIGDGCICALDSTDNSEHCLKLMGEADSGAFSGETDFLSEKNVKPETISAKTRISRGKSDTIMLMSDGVADDYFPAVPMMKRLYLDLCLNGILPMKGELPTAGEDPAPIRFKSVSMSQTSVALQYAKQLLADKSEAAMNALWEKREMLRCHSLEAFRMNLGDTPEQRLRVWLDNYNERGSFDDRTLVIIRLDS